ncbi:MAG TPA: hypothetical protein VHY22_05450 [Chthoniobacteraceae bacterium]|jgi:hypothetical protein|nr:hypothetical protein [Chthoniobacteraceae bacterium]
MTAAVQNPILKRKRTPEELKYLALWRDACLAQGWKSGDRELRMRIHTRLFGAPISSTGFSHAHFDRAIKLFKLLANSTDLDAAIELVGYEAHDAAQATHQPVIRPGKKFPQRRHASIYEQETRTNDPGERRRCVYVISRLFDPPYIDKIKRDLFSTARPWDELDIPDLAHLRDILRTRLSKWLTAAKQDPRAQETLGIDLASRNPRSPSGIASNAELIKRLLKRGKPVQMTAPPEEHPF